MSAKKGGAKSTKTAGSNVNLLELQEKVDLMCELLKVRYGPGKGAEKGHLRDQYGAVIPHS